MKRVFNRFFYLLLLGGVAFFSCSKDNDDFYEGIDLSVDVNIPLTRVTGEGNQVLNPSYDDIPEYEDECALYALAKLKNNYGAGNTAEDFYNSMKKYAHDNFGYEGGAMDMDVMLEVGRHFNLLSESTTFDGENSMTPSEYFSGGNRPKTIMIEGHTAKFVLYNKNTDRVRYTDSEGLGWVDANKVLGVMY